MFLEPLTAGSATCQVFVPSGFDASGGLLDPIVAGQPDQVRLVLALGGGLQLAGSLHRLVRRHDVDAADHRRSVHVAREVVGAGAQPRGPARS